MEDAVLAGRTVFLVAAVHQAIRSVVPEVVTTQAPARYVVAAREDTVLVDMIASKTDVAGKEPSLAVTVATIQRHKYAVAKQAALVLSLPSV